MNIQEAYRAWQAGGGWTRVVNIYWYMDIFVNLCSSREV